MRRPQGMLGWTLLLLSAWPLPARGEHPPVMLLDQAGHKVIESGMPISTMQSCGHCHDTPFIASHSYHASLGSDERQSPGSLPSGRPWDWSPGPFGRWSPLVYRYLPPGGDSRADRDTAEWIAEFGRHVGGGPSMVEMNCFLCHTSKPDNQARLKELRQGRPEWSNTATLASLGLVQRSPDGWACQREAFLSDGRLPAAKLGIRKPKSENCGLCHGLADRGGQPVALELSLRQWSTATEGQVFSPQRISESAVNVQDKERLTRPWDVHAERLLECTSCHFSLNDPAFYEPTPRSRPTHLAFEPRRLTVGQYVERPTHQFAKGRTSQGTLARHLDGTMRRCADCHNAIDTHPWLPYPEAHFARLSCEACHIPQVFAPAIRQVDWTLLTPDGEPQIRWRGIVRDPKNPTSLVTGFRPVLLPKQDLDGRTRLVPHNLVSAWYWVEGTDAPRPVRIADLKAALLQDGKYHPAVAAALNVGQGRPADEPSPMLDTPEKVDAVRRRLEAVGVVKPHIEAEIQPFGLHHGVGPAKWATRKCETCHAADSRLGERFVLASYVPGSVLPKLVGDSGVELRGQLQSDAQGQLAFQPSTQDASLYVLGHNRWRWVNALGSISLVGVVLGAVIHAGLRAGVAWKKPKTKT